MPFMRHRLFWPKRRLFLNTQHRSGLLSLKLFHDVSGVSLNVRGERSGVSGGNGVEEMPDKEGLNANIRQRKTL